MRVTVVTPSLPSRAHLLAEASASVVAQTVRPVAHFVGIDAFGQGPAVVRNYLLRSVNTEWVAFLDDDDLLDESHLEILLDHGNRADADVVIPYCRFSDQDIPPKYCNREYDREALRQHGIFPITVLARTAAISCAGYFGPERYEDWSLWNRLADRGAFFMVVPEVTWTYRLGHGNRTHGVNVA